MENPEALIEEGGICLGIKKRTNVVVDSRVRKKVVVSVENGICWKEKKVK